MLGRGHPRPEFILFRNCLMYESLRGSRMLTSGKFTAKTGLRLYSHGAMGFPGGPQTCQCPPARRKSGLVVESLRGTISKSLATHASIGFAGQVLQHAQVG